MGCCGNRNASSRWQVTFKDGSKTTVDTLSEARILQQSDRSEDPNGRRRAAAITRVPKL